MNQILKLGQTVQVEKMVKEDGKEKTVTSLCRIDDFLGGGGQGEVYRATLDGKTLALKWYFPASATTSQEVSLKTLIGKGAPNERFLWPQALATADHVQGFGYVMPLRPPQYKGIVDMMKRRIEPSFRALATACYLISDSFYQLHTRGLCYRDISFGNVFFDPKTGDVLIADNDNVITAGSTIGGVLGTPRFMAPEVVRGEAKPDTYTDLYSLAVLLFYMLMVHHPLEGRKELEIKCLDLPAMNKLYGTDPLFIFDPRDTSNAPVPGEHDNALAFWPLYPQFVRDLFIKSFTVGLKEPHDRVTESVWRQAMIHLRDSIFYCAQCGSENFYDADALRAAGGQPGACWSCGTQLRLPYRILLNRVVVMLNHDTQLYPHHIDDQRLYDFSQPVAQVTQHPTNPGLWGLKNLTQASWTLTTSEGAVSDVPPGRNAPLASGSRINFGKVEGEVRY